MDKRALSQEKILFFHDRVGILTLDSTNHVLWWQGRVDRDSQDKVEYRKLTNGPRPT